MILSGYIDPTIQSLRLRHVNGHHFTEPWIYFLQNHSKLEPTHQYRWMEPLWPAYGTILSGKLHYEFMFHQSMENKDHPCDYLHFQVQGLFEQRVETKTGIVESVGESSMEPGSWFIEISPLCADNDDNTDDLPSYGYLQYVLSHDEILRERVYPTSDDLSQDLYLPTVPASSSIPRSKIHVCIFGSDRMDGQKRIWLNQIQGMDPEEFAFSFILGQSMRIIDQHSNNIHTLRQILSQIKHLDIYESPLNDLTLSYEALAQGYLEHGTGKFDCSVNTHHHHSNGHMPSLDEDLDIFMKRIEQESGYLYIYAKERMLTAHEDIAALRPQWYLSHTSKSLV